MRNKVETITSLEMYWGLVVRLTTAARYRPVTIRFNSDLIIIVCSP